MKAAPTSALFTDLYQLTMLQAYFKSGLQQEAVFSLFVRRLPPERRFLLACGLDTVLEALETLRFTADDLTYLRSLNIFAEPFLDWLREWRFSGDVYAMPEGTPVFANEPILEVVAPLSQAQLIETLVLNQIQLQTLLASKAVRVVTAAQGRPVFDFGARRMHGTDSAVLGARAFHIAGVAGTSNVLAGQRFGIPLAGTMAHSYVQAHEDEMAAFRDFVACYPDTVLLIDTYDTLEGVRKVIRLAQEMGDAFRVRGLRIDSGDLAALAHAARQMLDDAGLQHVQLVASGGLDEYSVAALLEAGAPFDSFGVGTRMGVSRDVPDLDIVYKLCEYGGRGRLKLSVDKPILPGRKQVFRVAEGERDLFDIVARHDERLPGRPLLRQVMRGGKRLPDVPRSVDVIRAHAQSEMARLPAHMRVLSQDEPVYPVEFSDALLRYQGQVARNSVRE